MKSSITTQTKSVLTKGLKPALLVATVLLLGAASSALAGKGNRDNPRILPPHSHLYGKTYAEWAAAWTQWAFSIPVDQNPILDSTGEFSAVGQAGPVWFLAGNFGGTTVREVCVPAGKALFFPLFNQSWFQFPTDPPYTIEELRALLRPAMDGANLWCEIDGRVVQEPASYRVESTVFTTTVPDGNLLGIPAGHYEPCVDNGYYLMLAPLSAGRHTIHFTTVNADGSFSLDVTYHLTVLKDHRYGRGEDHCGDD